MRRAWLAVLALACAEAGVDAPADSSGFQPGDTWGTPGVSDAADPEPSADTAQEPQDVAQAPEVLPTDTGALDIGAPDDGALSDAETPDAALVDA